MAQPSIYTFACDGAEPYDVYTVQRDCRRLTFTPILFEGGDYYVKAPADKESGTQIVGGLPTVLDALADGWFAVGSRPIAFLSVDPSLTFMVKEE